MGHAQLQIASHPGHSPHLTVLILLATATAVLLPTTLDPAFLLFQPYSLASIPPCNQHVGTSPTSSSLSLLLLRVHIQSLRVPQLSSPLARPLPDSVANWNSWHACICPLNICYHFSCFYFVVLADKAKEILPWSVAEARTSRLRYPIRCYMRSGYGFSLFLIRGLLFFAFNLHL